MIKKSASVPTLNRFKVYPQYFNLILRKCFKLITLGSARIVNTSFFGYDFVRFLQN